MKFRTRYDAVVVGGGHNGLVAACYLARAGQSVLLLEREELGGATTSAAIFPGMDARLSRYSYLVSLLPQQIIDDLGLAFASRQRTIASCTPYRRAGKENALLLSNVDDGMSRASFRRRAGEEDWKGYAKLLMLKRAFAALAWPSLLQPLRSRGEWMNLLETALEREAWDAFVERPLGETIERLVRDDILRGVLFTDGKIGVFTHAHDPNLLQNRCFILHVIGGGTGEWQVPIGGMGALVEALVITARQAGAQLMTQARVVAIHPEKPHGTVVFELDGHEHSVEAARVLVSAGPQVFARLLGEPYATAPGDEGSVCKVNMVLHRLPRLRAGIESPDAFGGTLHIDESYSQLETSYRQAAAGQIPDRPPAEIYCHTLTDDSILGPGLRRMGYHTLTLFGLDVPYRLFETDHDAVRAEILRRYLEGLNRVLEDPIEECLAVDADGNPCIEIKSPIDLERELALNAGNIFHGNLSWFFADVEEQAGTWGVETRYAGIYRCGSSAMRGGGVSGIPGRNAAQCIFDELGIAGQ